MEHLEIIEPCPSETVFRWQYPYRADREVYTMVQSLQALGIDRMSVEDRIALATAIWDSIATEPHQPLLTEAQRLELDRRLADHAASPDDVVPWEQVKAEALARFQR